MNHVREYRKNLGEHLSYVRNSPNYPLASDANINTGITNVL